TTAYLTLAKGSIGGQYGLVVNKGGDFTVYGSTKTSWTTPTGNIGPGVTSFSVADATGWQAGDVITIDTEAVTIVTGGISGNTISNYTPGLGQLHVASSTVVGVISHNVVVRASGTLIPASGGPNTAKNSAYIRNLVQNTTSFSLTYG